MVGVNEGRQHMGSLRNTDLIGRQIPKNLADLGDCLGWIIAGEEPTVNT